MRRRTPRLGWLTGGARDEQHDSQQVRTSGARSDQLTPPHEGCSRKDLVDGRPGSAGADGPGYPSDRVVIPWDGSHSPCDVGSLMPGLWLAETGWQDLEAPARSAARYKTRANHDWRYS
jgi:hypothetical protein